VRVEPWDEYALISVHEDLTTGATMLVNVQANKAKDDPL